ncbi:unnamed protein product [Enterobius vermicularis]|uniref:Secreted protein n=1 Tax=Enterobius vermicularis TaxID=51028 RepID=A0A0N4V6K4_ENTVE|nr:unnamed protein product [Enterobius vermicularis]
MMTITLLLLTDDGNDDEGNNSDSDVGTGDSCRTLSVKMNKLTLLLATIWDPHWLNKTMTRTTLMLLAVDDRNADDDDNDFGEPSISSSDS